MDIGQELGVVVIVLFALILSTCGIWKCSTVVFESEDNSYSYIYESQTTRVTEKVSTAGKYMLATDAGFFEVSKEDYEVTKLDDIIVITKMDDVIDGIGDILDEISPVYWKVDTIYRRDENGNTVEMTIKGGSELPRSKKRR